MLEKNKSSGEKENGTHEHNFILTGITKKAE